MRCFQCQSEIPAEHAEDGAPISCAVCGHVQSVSALDPAPETFSPREIMTKWTEQRNWDPYGPLLRPTVQIRGEDATSSTPGTSSRVRSPQDPPTPWIKPDVLPIPINSTTLAIPPDTEPAASSEPSAPTAAAPDANSPSATETVTESTSDPNVTVSLDAPEEILEDEPEFELPGSRGYTIRIDEAHVLAGPHQLTRAPAEKTPWNWMSFAGQLLAYVGVATLTAGTILVLIGLHGQRPELTPTGWLVSTAGQMLLFLGIVTLVSAGMEQATRQFSTQVNLLNDRILRIERGHSGVPEPKFSQKRVRTPDPKAAMARLQRRIVELETQLSKRAR